MKDMKRIILVLVIVLCLFSCSENCSRLDWNNVPMHNMELVEQYLEEQGYKYDNITGGEVDFYVIEDSIKPDISLCHNKKGDINGMITERYKSMNRYDEIYDSLKNKYKDYTITELDNCTYIFITHPDDEIQQNITITKKDNSFIIEYRDTKKAKDGFYECY